MSFYAKLAMFWAALFGIIWLLCRFPNNPVSQLAFDWRGPYPAHGERLSKFMLRRAIYALKWFSQILLAFCALWLLASWRPDLAETSVFMLFWFALPLLGGTLLLAAIVYAGLAAKQHLFGPNPEFKAFDEQRGA